MSKVVGCLIEEHTGAQNLGSVSDVTKSELLTLFVVMWS